MGLSGGHQCQRWIALRFAIFVYFVPPKNMSTSTCAPTKALGHNSLSRRAIFTFNNTVHINFKLLFILLPSRGLNGFFYFNSGAAKYTTTAIQLYRTQNLAHLTWLFTRFLTAQKTVMDAVRLQGYLGYHNILHPESTGYDPDHLCILYSCWVFSVLLSIRTCIVVTCDGIMSL